MSAASGRPDAAVRQEALFAVRDKGGDILEPAIREAVEGRLEVLYIEAAHGTNICQAPCSTPIQTAASST
jgi:hypothetical protein